MGRGKSFLDKSMRLNGVVEILQLTRKKPISFTDMRDTSKIKFKKSLLKYMRFCVEKKLVRKKEGMQWKKITGWGHKYDRRVHNINYFITARGRKFLELVK